MGGMLRRVVFCAGLIVGLWHGESIVIQSAIHGFRHYTMFTS